jgi:EmrB/QacA subfamily drug resistance transporter
MTQLIVFRAIQGLGAGALMPLGMTIIGDIYTMAERARMQALFSGVWGLASVLGPVVGGFITDKLDWRWVFFINLPVGLLAAVVIGFALQEPKRTERPRIDYAGAATLTAAITLLMLGLVEGGTSIETLFAPLNASLFGGAVVLSILFVRIERRAVDPVVPLTMFRNRIVAVATTVGLLAGVAMFGAISFIPLYAQGVLGSTATEAGSLLTPLMLSWVLMSIVGGRMLLRFGFRPLCIVGLTLLTAGFIMLAMHDREMSRTLLYVDLAVIGSGLGFTMLTLLIAVQQSVPRTQLGIATSLNQFSRAIGGAIGVAVMGAVLTAGLASALDGKLNGLPSDPGALITPESRATLRSDELVALQAAMEGALKNVFTLGAVIAGCSLLAAFALPKRLPDQLGGAHEHHSASST